MRKSVGTYIAVLVLLGTAAHAFAGTEDGPLRPRVPQEHLAEARALVNPVSTSADSLSQGEAAYTELGCNGCHGDSGTGEGMGAALDPPAPNFTSPDWQAARTDGELRYTIFNGSEGTAMFASQAKFDDEADVWNVINYIRSLNK